MSPEDSLRSPYLFLAPEPLPRVSVSLGGPGSPTGNLGPHAPLHLHGVENLSALSGISAWPGSTLPDQPGGAAEEKNGVRSVPAARGSLRLGEPGSWQSLLNFRERETYANLTKALGKVASLQDQTWYHFGLSQRGGRECQYGRVC